MSDRQRENRTPLLIAFALALSLETPFAAPLGFGVQHDPRDGFRRIGNGVGEFKRRSAYKPLWAWIRRLSPKILAKTKLQQNRTPTHRGGSCFGFGSFGHWVYNCPDVPSYEEVEKVLQEHEEFFEEMKEEGLIWSADISKCPQGAFITMSHGGEWQKPLAKQIMDDAGAGDAGPYRFFGIPLDSLISDTI